MEINLVPVNSDLKINCAAAAIPKGEIQPAPGIQSPVQVALPTSQAAPNAITEGLDKIVPTTVTAPLPESQITPNQVLPLPGETGGVGALKPTANSPVAVKSPESPVTETEAQPTEKQPEGGTNIISIAVNNATLVRLERMPSVGKGSLRAHIACVVSVTAEVMADLEFFVEGAVLSGDLNGDQVVAALHSGQLIVPDDSSIELLLSYTADRDQRVRVSGPCNDGAELKNSATAFSANLAAELEYLAKSSASNKLLRRFLTVLVHESSPVTN